MNEIVRIYYNPCEPDGEQYKQEFADGTQETLDADTFHQMECRGELTKIQTFSFREKNCPAIYDIAPTSQSELLALKAHLETNMNGLRIQIEKAQQRGDQTGKTMTESILAEKEARLDLLNATLKQRRVGIKRPVFSPLEGKCAYLLKVDAYRQQMKQENNLPEFIWAVSQRYDLTNPQMSIKADSVAITLENPPTGTLEAFTRRLNVYLGQDFPDYELHEHFVKHEVRKGFIVNRAIIEIVA
jgi:hypothetical protein